MDKKKVDMVESNLSKLDLVSRIMVFLCTKYRVFPPRSLRLGIGLYKLNKDELRSLYVLIKSLT